MEDYSYLQDIEKIARGNEFLDYIVRRVSKDDYRGYQCSQQNRLTFSYFTSVIEVIYNTVGDKTFDIHVGDDEGVLQPQAATYYKIVKEIKARSGKGTINSVKKNTFPDIARMGFIVRYDKKGNEVDEGKGRSSIYSVKLSDRGAAFANARQMQRIKMFTDGVDALTKNAANDLAELLYTNDYGIESIDILEFMYIISDDNPAISTNDKLRLLLEYRRLSPVQKDELNANLKLFCNPKNRAHLDNKILLRDYGNWKNESQQIYGLLANSTYFKVQGHTLILNTGDTGIFDKNAKRGEKAKAQYFEEHHVDKSSGYELHHIVPFSRAQNKSDTVYVDDYKNLIYLSESKHSEFTLRQNRNVKLVWTRDKPQVLFFDFDEDYITVDIKGDALLSVAVLPFMVEYNGKLLKRFYHTGTQWNSPSRYL